jgi:CBASS immunity sensor of nucleotide second messenger signals/TIR domain-containing protein
MQPSQHISGLERPATAFLSYAREDAKEVKYLQQQLKVRGVRAWRDVTNLALGGSNKDEIIYAIEQEADAFVLYVTRESLASDFTWDIEVPTALSRWDRDHAFNIVPILHGVTFGELEQHCVAHSLRSLKEFNGVSLPEKATGATDEEFNRQLRQIAKRILEATLALRLRRVGADRKYEPCLYLRTYTYQPPTDSLDLDLNWTELFPGKDELPTEKEWDEILLPALDDVKNVLSERTSSRRLHMFVQAHLPAAFALGFAFPSAAHFTLMLEGRHGTWSTEGSASSSDPLHYLAYEYSGDAHVAVMEIAISRDTASGVTKSIPTLGISYKHHIRFDLQGGPDYLSGVQDASQALAMSHQIGRELRRLHDRKGVSHMHLFAALPAALAVMVGHQMNALGAISLYHFMEKDGLYVPVCTLGKQKASI